MGVKLSIPQGDHGTEGTYTLGLEIPGYDSPVGKRLSFLVTCYGLIKMNDDCGQALRKMVVTPPLCFCDIGGLSIHLLRLAVQQ